MPDLTAPASPYLTQLEAATYLRISIRTFRTHVAPVVGSKVGARCLYTREVLDAFIASRMRCPPAPPISMPRPIPVTLPARPTPPPHERTWSASQLETIAKLERRGRPPVPPAPPKPSRKDINAAKWRAVETCLRDPDWVAKGVHAIARHCGVGRVFVRKVRRG